MSTLATTEPRALPLALLLALVSCAGASGDTDAAASQTASTTQSTAAASSGAASTTADATATDATTAETGALTTSTTASTTSSTSASTTTSPSSTTTTDTANTATTGTTGEGGLVALQIDPPDALITIASGWSFPVQFTVIGVDGRGAQIPVDATWTVDDAALGEVTEHGGTFQARNTAAGLVTLTAAAAGLEATAPITVAIDPSLPTCPPRPPLTEGPPAPGAFVKVVAPEYQGTGVYHGVYLPPGWQPGRRYPVIVESPCNKYGSFTGKVDDAALGYHLGGCRDFLWIVVPYIQGQANLDYGWGDVAATTAYWRTNVARALEAHGGDPGAVVVAGFSRGAIGTSFIGNGDPEIADTWLAYVMHSHADVVSNLTPDQGAGSSARMQRIAGRASFLSWGAAGDGGQVNSQKGVDLLTAFAYPFETLAVPGVGHTDAWIATDAPSRQILQTWLFKQVAARTGTRTVRGRVTDGQGNPVEGAALTSGAHTVRTDPFGHYALRGLVPGPRAVACAHPDLTCSQDQLIDLADADVDHVDFVAAP